MPRRKSTPSKRSLPRDVPKRPRQGKRRPIFQRQRTSPLSLSNPVNWGEWDALRLEVAVDSELELSLTVLCKVDGSLQLQIDLTLLENDQVKLNVKEHKDEGANSHVSLAELFPDTYEAWRAHIATLAERELLRLQIKAKRQSDRDEWNFTFEVEVAWRKYMKDCSSRGLSLGLAVPHASPVRAMHHVMIWLLKRMHDSQSKVGVMCRFRYWSEIEVLYNRFVGDNTAVCAQFENETFPMPEIYARIDAARQLSRDIGDSETSRDLLPTLRQYQKAAVSWMLSREKPSGGNAYSLPLCVTFAEAAGNNLQAYDPYCAVFYTASSMQLRSAGMDLSSVQGGILADEMGLGKTVEVIALILSHRSFSLRPKLLSTHSTRPSNDEDDDVVACICGSSVDHPMGLVQCEFCGTWHHCLCTGYGGDVDLDATTGTTGVWGFEVSEKDEVTATSAWSSGGFMCYHCQSHERPSFASRTTLIVSPEPIHAQWEHEITRHTNTGALSVMRYPGVRALRNRLEAVGPSAEWQVLASPGLVLARYDIVLTTYEALGADLRHVPTSEGGDRRSSTRSQIKRYAFVGSPLVALKFWRVCMDEAQVGVENTRLQAALTLSRLSAENRWVVTGTPFSSHVSELFGYLRFLRISPYTSQEEDIPGQNLQLLQAEHNEKENLDSGFFRETVEHNFTRGAVRRVLDLLLWNGQEGEVDAVSGGGILWRTGKKHVLDQLGLPPQISEIVWCHFAAVERHFYDQQEKRIVSLIQQRQQQISSEVIGRDDRLWQDLLLLRQLCCHPQVGGARQAWGASGAATNGKVMTMDVFLQELVNKATRECEEAQRQLIGAQNGLAGLLVLNGDLSGAALKYMAVMSLIRTNWRQFRADLLPRLHILQNLEKCVQQLYSLPANEYGSKEDDGPMVDAKKTCVLPDIPVLQRRISTTGLQPGSEDLSDEIRTAISREYAVLGQCAQQVRQYYLLQTEMMHTQALTNFQKAFQVIDEAQQHTARPRAEMLCTSGNWWSDALSIIEESEKHDDPQLVARVQARLSGFDTRWGATFSSQLISSRSLRLLLVQELEALAKRRRELFDRLTSLSNGTPMDADVELSGNCKKCRDGGTGPVCTHCQLYKELDAYRRHFLGIDKTSVSKARIVDLFDDDDMEDRDTAETANTSNGMLAVSLFVEIFKEISGCARTALRSRRNDRGVAADIQSAMQMETEFWGKLHQEWQAAKKLFHTQHQRLGSLDELAMACSQLRLRQPDEPSARTKAEQISTLEPEELPVRTAVLEADRVAADLDLRDQMAQLRYLVQLQREAGVHEEEESKSDSSSQPEHPLCAVCLQEFNQRRAVLPCAHVFCTNCVSTLAGHQVGQHSRRNVRCPTCRRVCPADSVTIVVEREMQVEVVSEMPNRPPLRNGGSLGSKLDALLARVDFLRQENPSVKCLLFSQWTQMLEMAVHALPRLGVRCFLYGTKRQLPKLLTQFQTCPSACVLALPFKVGANGLNIVEATEVLLIEPLLTPSIEAQAVNRVHRLGQTQRTRVHRFIVQDSVEERIFRLGHTLQANNAGVEQATNEEDGDEGLQRLGVAPGRKEQEKLTMQGLRGLLSGNVDDPEVTRAFWEKLVVLNGKTVNRTAAYEFLQRRFSTQSREGGQNQHINQSTQTKLYGRSMEQVVAEELLHLPFPVSVSSGD
ncbi:E3 ubiquitin-protein ligase SHPRH [Phytophthora citrophthora]|uniref:E3 ubiquitin-protein ligase SHPRH n=1 Tax=Phytophthora citrophthora TaxID=4793 RepID=A0AAD9GEU7_9STRA|nr:E3 ubiquitin-protein ligase SHPRH [Phytophthora citrophthora]